LREEDLGVRKYLTIVEDTRMEMGHKLERYVKKSAAMAVIHNPYAGRYSEDLQILIDAGELLGSILGRMAREALGISPSEVESYGKGAIVGEDGEIEHGHAILHPKLGASMRNECGGHDACKAIIPSTVKIGGPHTIIDIPLHYKNAAFVRSHYDTMTVSVPDAPKRDEIVVVVVFTNSGRPLPRIGGLRKEEVKGLDGLR
jgi:hypothetical protein